MAPRLLIILLSVVAFGCERPKQGIASAARYLHPPGQLIWLSYSTRTPFVNPNGRGVPLIPDSKIRYDIEARIMGPLMGTSRIRVRVDRQNVLLTGRAPTGTQAEAAEAEAWRVDGVAAVINRISLY